MALTKFNKFMYKYFKKPFDRLKRKLDDSMGVGSVTLTGELEVKHIKDNGMVIDMGVIGRKLVTTAFVNDLVQELVSSTGDIANYYWHGSGSSTASENNAHTALTTEVGTRSTGTQTTGASANIYETVGTCTYSTAGQIGEHGVFNSSSSGTLMDRHAFAAINVSSGDSIQFTYRLTCNAET